MKLKTKRIRPDAKLPEYKTPGAAGFDLASAENITISMNSTRAIPTGLQFEIPEGYEIQIRPRSGLSLNTGLRVSNSPGTIDSDFRGEVCILLENRRGEDYKINKGDRIAQGILAPVSRAEFVEEEEELSETERGEGGFGSTDKGDLE